MDKDAGNGFEQMADQEVRSGLIRDFWCFLRYSKKWWLTPIVILLLLLGLMMVLGSTAAAPFIYTLF